MNGQYILKDKEPVAVEDLMEWANWLETANRNVAFDVIDENIEVSTIFLGLDYGYHSNTPLLFETMILGGEHDRQKKHYSTWDEAVKGHHEMVALAFETKIEE